jgi:hypothetical protein
LSHLLEVLEVLGERQCSSFAGLWASPAEHKPAAQRAEGAKQEYSVTVWSRQTFLAAGLFADGFESTSPSSLLGGQT